MKGKIAFILGALLGYVLGARAGRKRYEQIKAGAEKVWNTPPVQTAAEHVKDFLGAQGTAAQSFAGDAVRAGLALLAERLSSPRGGATEDTPTGDNQQSAGASAASSGETVPSEDTAPGNAAAAEDVSSAATTSGVAGKTGGSGKTTKKTSSAKKTSGGSKASGASRASGAAKSARDGKK
ncbi:hypothetical protein [Lysinibacter sp. HNR]|uniref:hypothetical protein n=1 Tax=Lysinibacter sp. HNR TaxID=3031408 RepID=UPI002434B40A|nr:hypothetical protein [Lysinibacter sp. HNR]WGD37649.1 hypothetical protein FrondiHNR_01665 [Lysinibacter sp. HNR]